jgi:hypothetical protein
MKLGMIGTQQYQEGFKAPYRGLPFKPPPLAVVIDWLPHETHPVMIIVADTGPLISLNRYFSLPLLNSILVATGEQIL